MANNEVMNEDDFENVIVTFTDEDGKEILYMQEMIIPINGQDFALLVGIDDNTEDGIRYIDGEEDVIIAKMVPDQEGEIEYIEPSDEEYEAVNKAYNDMMDELEANEK